jgi:hypothetical protein
LAGFTALALVGCSQGAAPSSTNDIESHVYTPTPDTSDHTSRYTFADGSVNYDLLRQDFGEPNQNIILNPQATDVATTTSQHSVTIGADRLTFVASGAAWLDAKKVGETLYCNSSCGQHGFMRNIVSVEKKAGLVVVTTKNAAMTDIIKHGWLHHEAPIVMPVDPNAGLPGLPQVPNPDALNPMESDTANTPEHVFSKSESYTLTGQISGSITGSASFQATLVTDLVIGLHWSWSAPVTIDLFRMVAQGTPQIGFKANFKATVTATKDIPIGSDEAILGEIPLGPIIIVPTLGYDFAAHVKAEGAVTVNASSTVSDTLKIGFSYTSARGASSIFSNKLTNVNSITMSGQVKVKAYISLEETLAFKIFDVAGPAYIQEIAAGFEGEGKLVTTPECAIDLGAHLYFELGGKIGVIVGVGEYSYKATLPLTSIAPWVYPKPDWSKQILLPATSPLCPHTGTSTGTHSSSTGSHSSSTGSHSSSSSTGSHASSTGTTTTATSTTGTTGGTTGGTSTATSTGTTTGGGTTGTTTTGGTTTGTTSAGTSTGTTGSSNVGDCGNGPVDFNSDPTNCGYCGVVCVDFTADPTSTCNGGTCGCHCLDGSVCPSTDTSTCP